MKLSQKIIWIAGMVFVAVGCTNENNDTSTESDVDDSKLIRYETKEEQNERLGINDYGTKDYYQSDEEGITPDGNERILFDNKESLLIAQKLEKRPDIKQAQVATVDDNIIVFVTLKDYTNDNITNNIKSVVQEIVPNKEIIIFTDDIHWNRMRNLQAGLKQKEIGENVEQYLEQHFDIQLKDD